MTLGEEFTEVYRQWLVSTYREWQRDYSTDEPAHEYLGLTYDQFRIFQSRYLCQEQ